MHPDNSGLICLNNVHLVVGTIFCWNLPGFLNTHAALNSTLLRIEIRTHVLAAISKFILETNF